MLKSVRLLCAMLLLITTSTTSCRKSSDDDLLLALLSLIEADSYRDFVYFTRPEPEAGLREKERTHRRLIELIESAEERIEIWCYGFNEELLLRALTIARNRGIELSIIGSQDQSYTRAKELGLPVRMRARTGLQHVKLILIDRTWLATGSGNMTHSGLYQSHNVWLIFPLQRDRADQLAEALYFERRWPDPIDLAFGVDLLISPIQGRMIQLEMIRSIVEARYRIRFLIFSHTDRAISESLLAAARRGVFVEGIYNTTRDEFPRSSEAYYLNDSLADTAALLYTAGNRERYEAYPGEFHGGHLHHKTILIDDSRVVTGSYNWSVSARDSNLEVLLRIDHPAVAQLFAEEFARIVRRAKPMTRNPSSRPTRFQFVRDEETRQICWTLKPGESAPAMVSSLSGEGLFLRLELWNIPRNQQSQSGCVDLDRKSNQSAGVTYASSFPLPEGATPCRNCRPVDLLDSNLGQGWLRLPEAAGQFESLQVWHRNGLSTQMALTPGALPGLYHLPASGHTGSSLLFLRHSSNEIYYSCEERGQGLSVGALLFARMAAHRHGGRAANCSRPP